MTELITTIIAATVYPENARVIRRGSIKLNPGAHTIEVPKLPLELNPVSLRASIYGAGSPHLLGAQVKRILYTDQPSDPMRNLEDEIEKMQDELRRLDVKPELIKKNLIVLKNFVG